MTPQSVVAAQVIDWRVSAGRGVVARRSSILRRRSRPPIQAAAPPSAGPTIRSPSRTNTLACTHKVIFQASPSP